MEGREKPDIEKWREIMRDWNCDNSSIFTALLVWYLEKF
jgi:hypothetical protein